MKTNMGHNLLPSTLSNHAYDPVDRLFGRLIGDFFGDNTLDPETEYEEMEDQYRIRVAVPGLSKKDLKLRLEDNVLYLSGEVRQSQRGSGSQVVETQRFERSFVLPADADASRIKARCRHGLLAITLPKSRPASKAKRIPVHGEADDKLSPRRWLAEAKRRFRGHSGNGSKQGGHCVEAVDFRLVQAG